MKNLDSIDEMLDTHCTPIPDSGCWLWLRARNPNGYGLLRFTGSAKEVPTLAHRHAYTLVYGNIPDGMCVLHRCDVRCCVNPDHLFLGTHLDNMADMRAKGRGSFGWRHSLTHRGASNGRAKLADADILLIRESAETARALAKRYGVHFSTIYQIKQRSTWKHIDAA